MHDTQKVQEDQNKQLVEKPFNIAELHKAAFRNRRQGRHYYEIDEDDDADCYCD